jgi:hypothetical protein
MTSIQPDQDPEISQLERRWFAAARAADDARSECDALVRVLELTRSAWRDARARLARLEALRDALGGEISAGDPCAARPRSVA